jgi:hypothetical protein
VELDVTPFINPDGEVSMDIQQEYDGFNGSTPITGVGDVPNTIKRTLNTSITVRDRDTVMLGGFIKSDKEASRSGVPFLSSIPILGNLFTTRSDKKDRSELIVLMRPTVLRTPELLAKNTIQESQRLPAISRAIAEDTQFEKHLVDEERKRELKAAKNGSNTNGFYNLLVPAEPSVTNSLPSATLEYPVPTTASPAPAPKAAPVVFPEPPQESRTAPAAPVNGPPSAGMSAAQQKKLHELINDYIAGRMAPAQFEAEQERILSGK